MTPFEEQLKQALARREPPPDFTARVLARAGEQDAQRAAGRLAQWFRRRRMWALAPALAACLAMSAGIIYDQHERMVRGEAAKEKLLLALQIAGSKLHNVQQQVVELEATEIEQ